MVELYLWTYPMSFCETKQRLAGKNSFRFQVKQITLIINTQLSTTRLLIILVYLGNY